jgi:hypothetical protein
MTGVYENQIPASCDTLKPGNVLMCNITAARSIGKMQSNTAINMCITKRCFYMARLNYIYIYITYIYIYIYIYILHTIFWLMPMMLIHWEEEYRL